MKILFPKSVENRESLDDYRLGKQVESTTVEKLPQQKHGIVFIGIAEDRAIQNSGGRLGAKTGADAIRMKLFKFTAEKLPFPLYDLGDVQAQDSVENTHETAAVFIQRIHEAGHTPVVLGGSHDLAFAEALGLLRVKKAKYGFLNVDAHLDLRPTTYGITSGSPWFMLQEHPLFAKGKIIEFGIQPHCNAQSLVEYAKKHKIEIHWLKDIHSSKSKTQAQLKKLFQKLSSLDGIQFSFDIDSVNWAEAPGCSAPQTIGFSAKEAIEMCHLAGTQKKLKSFGLYELSPSLDRDGQTATLAAHCINAFLHGRALISANRKK